MVASRRKFCEIVLDCMLREVFFLKAVSSAFTEKVFEVRPPRLWCGVWQNGRGPLDPKLGQAAFFRMSDETDEIEVYRSSQSGGIMQI